MQTRELKDILISAIALALAFAIALSGGIEVITNPAKLIFMTSVSLIAVSSGFVLHEMLHRLTAKKFGCRAEYQMWPTGLVLAIAFSLIGFVFAAPGAVMIYPRVNLWGRAVHLSKKAYGIISISGPLANMALAVAFMALNIFYPSPVFELGKSINIWLAIFNLIPFPPLDGFKIFIWDSRVWLAAAVVAGIIFVL
jgi:Zn-dependent protease